MAGKTKKQMKVKINYTNIIQYIDNYENLCDNIIKAQYSII